MRDLRTKSHGIDFLIFDEKHRCIAINTKAGESANAENFEHLHWFADLYEKEKFAGIVLYADCRMLSFGGNCYAVPMPALWASQEHREAR